MTASSEQKPQIVDVNLNEIINATEIYSGMYARVSIRFFPYINSGKKGIGCGLGNVQKLEDGEPLGGRTNAADDFGGAGGGFNPAYQAPQQQPAYAQPPQQYPTYAPPAYQPQPPNYGAPQQQPQQFDPITGAPINGGVMGI